MTTIASPQVGAPAPVTTTPVELPGLDTPRVPTAQAVARYFRRGAEHPWTALETPASLQTWRGRFLLMTQSEVVSSGHSQVFLGGDALLHEVEFGEGGARYRSKVVLPDPTERTPMAEVLQQRTIAGTMLGALRRRPLEVLRGVARGDHGAMLGLERAANEALYPVGDEVYSGTELVSPVRIDRELLGHPPALPPRFGRVFSAHGRPDGRGTTFAMDFDMITGRNHVWALRADGGAVRARRLRGAPDGFITHDVMPTTNYLIGAPLPVRLSAFRPVARWPRRPAELVLIRHSDDARLPEVIRVPTHGRYLDHFAVCREEGDELLITGIGTDWDGFVGFAADRAQAASAVCYPTELLRIRVCLRSGRVRAWEAARPLGPDVGVEFPSPVDPGGDWTYLVAFTPDGLGVARVHVQTFEAESFLVPGAFLCEPQRVVDPVSGTAWLVTLMFDATAEHSAVLVFDPEDIARGPVERMALPKPAGRMLHSLWVPAPESNRGP